MTNSVYASTGYTLFYVNDLYHPSVTYSTTPWFRAWWGGIADWLADVSPFTAQKQFGELLATRLNVLIHVLDEISDR